MSKNYKRKIMLDFDYGQLKEGVTQTNHQMRMLNAEYKASKSEAIAMGDASDKLGIRQQYLTERLKIVNDELKENQARLEEAKNKHGDGSKQVENYTAKVAESKAQLKELNADLVDVNVKLAEQSKVLGKTSEEWKSFSDKANKMGKDFTTKVTLPIVAAGAGAFKLAADYEQALGKMEVVFEKNSDDMRKWADNALQTMGLSKMTATQVSSDFGALFKGMGFTIDQSAEWSKELTARVTDLSNFYDTSTDETINALNAIVTGQTEPLRKFGINMTQATLQEYAFANGINKKVSEMTEAEKVQLRYNFVMERTKIAVGTTARESGSASAQMAKFKEIVKELGINFGNVLLPVIVPIIEKLNTFLTIIAGLNEGTKKTIVTIAMVVATIGPVLLIVGKVAGAISNITSLQAKWAEKTITAGAKTSKAVGGMSVAFDGVFVKIIAVVGAVTLLVVALNFLFGRGKEMQDFANSLGSNSAKISNSLKGTARSINSTKMNAYAVGSKYIEYDQVAQIHKGEAVVPAHLNPWNPANKGNGLGGDTIILNVSMDEVGEVYKLLDTVKKAKQVRRAGGVEFA